MVIDEKNSRLPRGVQQLGVGDGAIHRRRSYRIADRVYWRLPAFLSPRPARPSPHESLPVRSLWYIVRSRSMRLNSRLSPLCVPGSLRAGVCHVWQASPRTPSPPRERLPKGKLGKRLVLRSSRSDTRPRLRSPIAAALPRGRSALVFTRLRCVEPRNSHLLERC